MLLVATSTILLTLTLFCTQASSTPETELKLSDELDRQEAESFKAIRSLHTKLDSDADGEVDDVESMKFLQSDKVGVIDNKAGSTAHKLSYLHQDGRDRSISVNELWDAWKSSIVYNWTVDETIYWLENCVELSEYSSLFQQHSINGSLLPRLAADTSFISRIGISDPSAKSKISIKAMDVVLFGPPKSGSNSKVRDIIVFVVTLIAVVACYIFYARSQASELALQAMQSNLESLQKAEDQMLELHQELNRALETKEAVVTEKRNLEHQLEMQRQFSATSLSEPGRLKENQDNSNGDNSTKEQNQLRDDYLAKLEIEVKDLREELQATYDSMAAKKFRAPTHLRNLLQATYDMESQYYNEKKLSLESKASEVKLRNAKLQKKKTSFLGYYKMAQENSLEDDLNVIMDVKEAILQVTKEIKERNERWRAIEELCGCSISKPL